MQKASIDCPKALVKKVSLQGQFARRAVLLSSAANHSREGEEGGEISPPAVPSLPSHLKLFIYSGKRPWGGTGNGIRQTCLASPVTMLQQREFVLFFGHIPLVNPSLLFLPSYR